MVLEEWKPVYGYEGFYEVSTEGRVRSLPRATTNGGILKPIYSKDGYASVHLSREGHDKIKRINRLVAEAFIPNPENKPEVNHLNGIRDDNRLCNLEWATTSENNLHACRVLGRDHWSRGKKLPYKPRKLTWEQVHAILNDTRSNREIAREYGVSHGTIGNIKKKAVEL